MGRIFILSPADCNGRRARLAGSERAAFDLARRLRGGGVGLGELFTFLSGLYFRGKLAYASAFADPPEGCPGVLVITPCMGLLPPETVVTRTDLELFAACEIRENEAAFTVPFGRDASALADCADPRAEIVLLGSIATGKYLKVLLSSFGPRLKFPAAFVGRGDMSRGAILLRAAADGIELDYAPVEGTVLHGKRPERLAPRRYEKARGD